MCSDVLVFLPQMGRLVVVNKAQSVKRDDWIGKAQLFQFRRVDVEGGSRGSGKAKIFNSGLQLSALLDARESDAAAWHVPLWRRLRGPLAVWSCFYRVAIFDFELP
jgi:hypothetical protein